MRSEAETTKKEAQKERKDAREGEERRRRKESEGKSRVEIIRASYGDGAVNRSPQTTHSQDPKPYTIGSKPPSTGR